MKMAYLLFLFSFLHFSASAFSPNLALKGGLNYTKAKIIANANSWDDFKGMGFNTHFGHRWGPFELNLSSYIYWGGVENISFITKENQVTGDGNFRHVSFGPMFKYTFEGLQPITGWHFYSAVGPSWSLQTIKMKEFQSTGSFTKDHKITYESFGGTLSIGIEENLPFNDQHPVYFEFIYSFTRSRRVVVIDASDFTEVNVLSVEDGHQRVNGHFFMIAMGITIF